MNLNKSLPYLWSKMSCSFYHRGVQLILAYSWSRPVGKGRGGMLLLLLHLHFLSFPSFFLIPLSYLLYYLFSLFSLSQEDNTKWPTRFGVSLNPNTCQPQWLSWMRPPTGDQEVTGSTPCRGQQHSFLWSFSPFLWFKKGSCQFLAKECTQYWLTA